jgi:hypothetical protein
VPLSPSRAGNGCLQTIPGTHKFGPRGHRHEGKYLLNCNASMTEEDFRQVVENELDPGDIVAHHGLSLHGSSQNRSDELRTTYIIQYAAADAFAYTAPVIDSRHRNAMVRGKPATMRASRLERSNCRPTSAPAIPASTRCRRPTRCRAYRRLGDSSGVESSGIWSVRSTFERGAMLCIIWPLRSTVLRWCCASRRMAWSSSEVEAAAPTRVSALAPVAFALALLALSPLPIAVP